MESSDRLLQRLTPNESHGVIRTSVLIDAHAVDRNDTGVFEAAGDLGLEQKPSSTGLIVGVAIEDLLERHLTIEFRIECDEHRPKATPRMRTQHAESLAPRARSCERIGSARHFHRELRSSRPAPSVCVSS